MATYFGHRPAWARPKPTGFSVPSGGPLATTNPNPYNTSGNLGREGQIIPPKSGRNPYPRGKSLPGYKGVPSAANALERAAMARAKAFKLPLALRGLLSPLAMAQLIGDLMWGGEYYATPQEWVWPTGWHVCPTPSCAGNVTHFQWAYSNGLGDASSCAVQAACPVGQAFNNSWPVPNEPPVVMPFFPPRDVLYLIEESPTPGIGTWRAQGVRPVNFGTGTTPVTQLPSLQGGSLPLRAPDPFAEPKWREKTYPRNRPIAKPKDRMWGDRLPPRGSTKYPDYPHVPPPPRVKEKKGLVIAGGRAAKIYGAATEFRDFADCLAANIPGNPCGKYRRQLHKYAYCIAMNEAKINMPEAMVCFFEKQSEDKHIGGTFGHVGGAAANSPDWIRPVGPQAGGWAAPKVPKMTPI